MNIAVPADRLFEFQSLLQRSCQLIGAGGGLAAAGGAFQPGDDFLNIHAFHQGGDALQIAIATAHIFHTFQLAVFDFKIDVLGTGSFGFVFKLHSVDSFR